MRGHSVRGSRVRETIPQLGRVSGLWLVVSSVAVIVASTSSYLLFGSRIAAPDRGSLLTTVIIETLLLLAGLCGLALFSTHRIGGPWIAFRRVCEAVRGGDRHARLRLRAIDSQLKPVEEAFNAMLDELMPPSPTGDPADRGR